MNTGGKVGIEVRCLVVSSSPDEIPVSASGETTGVPSAFPPEVKAIGLPGEIFLRAKGRDDILVNCPKGNKEFGKKRCLGNKLSDPGNKLSDPLFWPVDL